MWGVSYWFWPLFSGTVWLAMLLAMLIHWLTAGKPHYSYMVPDQTIPYISHVGASDFKPLFIAMGTVTVVTFDLVFIAERWLRHKGRLTHNTSLLQKILAILSILSAIAGAIGLILLTIYDTASHPSMHDACLVVFLAGYILSAIFVCWEYQRLGIHFRQHRILRISFWIKLAFILIEIGLAIGFGVCSRTDKRNDAAILEWVVALVYTFYVWSYFIDFIPAVHSKHHQSKQTTEMAASGSADSGLPMAKDEGVDRYGNDVEQGRYHGAPMHGHAHGNGYANGNGYTNGNGHVNGYGEKVLPARRNF